MTRPSALQLEVPVAPESAQPSATTPALEASVAPTTVSPAESVVPLATPHVAQHPRTPVWRAMRQRTIALAGVTCLVVAAFAFVRHASAPGTDDGAVGWQLEPLEQPADLGARRPQPAVLPAAPIAAPVAASATIAPRAASAPSHARLVPKPERNRIAESTRLPAPIATVTRVADIAFKEDAAAKMPGSDATAPAAASVSIGGGTTPVTITGCLEISVDHDEFRLTDTDGVDAPKSRSWRSGFLKKRSTPVALVEPPDRLALQTHVGRRVAATGLLTSHDLQVSALRVVGQSCN